MPTNGSVSPQHFEIVSFAGTGTISEHWKEPVGTGTGFVVRMAALPAGFIADLVDKIFAQLWRENFETILEHFYKKKIDELFEFEDFEYPAETISVETLARIEEIRRIRFAATAEQVEYSEEELERFF